MVNPPIMPAGISPFKNEFYKRKKICIIQKHNQLLFFMLGFLLLKRYIITCGWL